MEKGQPYRTLNLLLRDDDNLFVRLSPKVAQDLKNLANADAPIPQNERCWTLENDDSSFLPLSIDFCGETVFASYNGGYLEQSGKN